MKVKYWSPPIALSKGEARIVKAMKQRHLFTFLRMHRHTLFNQAFQDELLAMYDSEPGKAGRPPLPPAMLAMVTLLQAYTGISDAEAVDLSILDLRWCLVLGNLGSIDEGEPLFSQGALPAFRRRMMAHDMDRRLLERTVDLARQTGDFGHKNLRLALDGSPLFTASRVEDSFNLLGHATRKVLEAVLVVLGRKPHEQEALALEAGIPLLAADPGAVGGSLKARLDVAWEKPEEKAKAFARLVNEIYACKAWLDLNVNLKQEPLKSCWAVVAEILGQDVEPDPINGEPSLKHGVAPERRPSIEDGEARHGRKSRSQKFVGYKRHLALDLTSGLVLAVRIAPANKPEGAITPEISLDLNHLLKTETIAPLIGSLHVDRAYLTSPLVGEVRKAGGAIFCRPWAPSGLKGRFGKSAFTLNFPPDSTIGAVTCPAGTSIPAIPGKTSHYSASVCNTCPQRERCTTSKSGRSLNIHIDELFHQELRVRQATPEGRAGLRERVAVEHALARQVSVQGRKARYKGTRKNLLAARLSAGIVNLYTHDLHERKENAA